MTQQEKEESRSGIQELLQKSTAPHLADCLDLVPDELLEAMIDMVLAARFRNVQTSVIRLQVVEDMTAIVAGFPDGANFSKPFLNAKNIANETY